MNDANVFMATGAAQWQSGKSVILTFSVTDMCNLACSYCYMVNKNRKRRMTFEIAKKIVDYVLNNEYLCKEEAVVWDFIGGEPLLEMELIEQICDYIVAKMYIMKHKWFHKYRFSFSTNGTLFHEKKVQDFIFKHRGHCWFSFSLDGIKEKHDLSRKKLDGTGSYDDVVNNIPLYLKYFPEASAKATFAHDDLPYLKDSIIHIWNLGIKTAASNVVYEDVWQDGDDIIFEKQLMELADYVIDNELWDQYSTSFFNSNVGLPIDAVTLNRNRCVAGDKSLAFDCEGNFYPCVRFLDMCFEEKNKVIVGNINDGLNMDFLRSFISLTWKNQSSQECNNCDVGSGCGWCTAHNYEISGNDTIYERSTAICKMHKANARANHYFWKRYTEKTGKTSPYTVYKLSMNEINEYKYLYFITSDDITPHCSYINNKKSDYKMPQSLIAEGLSFCTEKNLIPVFIGKCNHGLKKDDNIYFELLDQRSKGYTTDNFISIFDNVVSNARHSSDTGILLLNKENISQLYDLLTNLFVWEHRVNLYIKDLNVWEEKDLECYQRQLKKVAEYLYDRIKSADNIQLNVITDHYTFNTRTDCGAGTKSIALAPNGKIYVCPAFYFNDPDFIIGDIENGIKKLDKKFYKWEEGPICAECDLSVCSKCLFHNKSLTREIHIPSEIQCRINHIQKKISNELKQKLIESGLIAKRVDAGETEDPFTKILNRSGGCETCQV